MASPLSLGVIGEETSARTRKQGETGLQLTREIHRYPAYELGQV
jgi:hypothetical protein